MDKWKLLVQREISHMRFGYYVISATSVEVYLWMTDQSFYKLTLFLLRDFI